jgi:hypothetical protein
VGKQGNRHTLPQEEINGLIVRKAKVRGHPADPSRSHGQRRLCHRT